MIEMDGDEFVYREQPLPLWLRAFAVFLGVGIATVIPAPFIIYAAWSTFSPVLLLVAACIVIPILLGCFFVFIGLVSATELRIDPIAKVLVRRLRGPIVNRTDRFPLSQIELPQVFMRKSQEEDDFPILRLRLPRGKVDMACFTNKADADAWADQIKHLLRN